MSLQRSALYTVNCEVLSICRCAKLKIQKIHSWISRHCSKYFILKNPGSPAGRRKCTDSVWFDTYERFEHRVEKKQLSDNIQILWPPVVHVFPNRHPIIYCILSHSSILIGECINSIVQWSAVWGSLLDFHMSEYRLSCSTRQLGIRRFSIQHVSWTKQRVLHFDYYVHYTEHNKWRYHHSSQSRQVVSAKRVFFKPKARLYLQLCEGTRFNLEVYWASFCST